MGRVLIVSDDPKGPRRLADFLRGEGFLVDHAVDGLAALRRLYETPFDSVVLDETLAGSSALHILPLLRVVAPESPVVLITAGGDQRIVEDASARGAYDIVVKPFRLGDLLSVLRRAGACAPRALAGAATGAGSDHRGEAGATRRRGRRPGPPGTLA